MCPPYDVDFVKLVARSGSGE